MTHALAIAARELRERWILFPAALAFGVLPIVLPAFGPDFRDIAPVVGVAFAVVLGAAAAVVVGSTMLARDAAEGRLAFLLARPVSLAAVWTGKWIAALVLVLGSGLLAALPWMTVTAPPESFGSSWLSALANGPGAVMFAGLAVLAVGVANFNAAAFRSRSAWLALDLALLVSAVLVVRRCAPPFLRFGFLDALNIPEAPAFVWMVGAALLVGSTAQLVIGRTDLRRAHHALSTAAWLVVWAVLAGIVAAVWWVRAATPPELRAWSVVGGPAGRWVQVTGAARVRGWASRWPQSVYLIDGQTHRYVRRPDETVFAPILFSGDGRVAVQMRPDRDERGTAAEVLHLDGSRLRSTLVTLEKTPPLEGWASAVALSPDSRVLVYVHSGGASLFELPSGRRVTTATAPPGFRPAAARFTGGRTARAWFTPDDTLRKQVQVVDLSFDGASSTRSFAVEAPVSAWDGIAVDAAGDRLLTFDGGVRLRDAADGRLIATLVDTAGSEVPRRGNMLAARLLADGRVVAIEGLPRDGGRAPRVTVFGADGSKLREAVLDGGLIGLSVGPELPDGRVVVTTGGRPPKLLAECRVLDTGTGAVVQELGNIRPVAAERTHYATGPAQPNPVQIFTDEQGRVLRIDTTTGAREVVSGPGAPAGELLKLD